jgi:hypothetical protein
MMTCEEASRLVSEKKDHHLPWRKRVGLRIHLLMCRMCRVYESQLQILTRISRSAGDLVINRQVDDVALPVDAKQRIKQRLGRVD